MGDDYVLITRIYDEIMLEIWNQPNHEVLSLFHSVQKWDPDIASGNKVVWVRCYSIPLQAWEEFFLSLLANKVGSLEGVDEDTLTLKYVEYARIW